MKAYLAFIALLMFQPVVYSQLTVSIDQQYQCENTEILVPVLVSDFNDVSSLTLFIQINTQELEFVDVVNKSASLNGGNLTSGFSNAGDDMIVITWWRNSPVTISSGKLFDLKLHYYGGAADLILHDDCEIALSDLTVVSNLVLNDGLIEPVEISITTQPQDQTVEEDDTAQFIIEQSGAIGFQWQSNAGDAWSNLSDDVVYSGVTTSELTINNVPLEMDNYLFRCVAVINDCSLASEEAVLLVNPLGIINRSGKTPGLDVYPNPFNDKLNFVFESPSGSIGLRMLNLLGKTVYQSLTVDYDNGGVGNILTNDLQPGLYFLQLLNDDTVLVTVKLLKQ